MAHNLRTVIVKASDADSAAMALKKQYYALRTKAFAASWGEQLYPEGPDSHDARPDTTFILLMDADKVVAGVRLLMHRPGSEEKVACETNHAEFDLRNLMPHLDVNNLSYCECGGLIADPDPKYKALHLGTQMLADMFQLIQSGDVQNNGAKLDTIIASCSKTSVGCFIRAASEKAMKGVVRTDHVIREQDERFDTKLWPMIFSPNADFLFVPEALKHTGVAVPVEEFQAYRYTDKPAAIKRD